MNQSERIAAALLHAGMTKAELARACDVSDAAVGQWLNQSTKAPKAENIFKIARATGVSPEWLTEGKGEMVAPGKMGPGAESNVSGPPLTLRQGRVPVIGTAQLGTEGYFEPMEYPVGHGDGYLLIYSDDEDAYGLKVVGNSMMPRIRHGEYVVIEPNHDYGVGDEVLVRTSDGQAMIKEFISCRDGQYRFQSINNDFEPIYFDENDVECVQYMSAIVKAARYVP